MASEDEYILAIESSCDDTAAAVSCNGSILSNLIAGQQIHAEYGGIVPEVASRMHQENITAIVDAALKKANVNVSQLSAIACTTGPGLLGSLTVGINFAKGLALSLQIPFIGVNHMRAHVLSHFINEPHPSFPFLNLTVSGGHTQIILVKSISEMEVIGQTRDDAAGEAFDKSGKILGLPYPAGPQIDKLATNGKPVYKFPVPQIPGYDFSFSGIKTAILYFIRDEVKKDPDFILHHINDICASIQHAIVEILARKILAASLEFKINQIGISGGVAANSGLRKRLHALAHQHDWNVYFPAMEFCTDNAAMVAITAQYLYRNRDYTPLDAAPYVRGME